MKVLIVDDHENILIVMKYILIQNGFTVVTSLNGNQALDLYDDSFDLVLCDLLMPEMNGFQFIDNLFTKNECAKVGIITGGYNRISEIEGDFDYTQCLPILIKPFCGDELMKFISIVDKYTPFCECTDCTE